MRNRAFQTATACLVLALSSQACNDSSSSGGTGPLPVTSPPPTSATAPTGPAGQWTSIFDDEFDGTQLDTTKWNLTWPWSTPLNSGLQTYTAANTTVSGGSLHLAATTQNAGGQASYFSGAVTTYNMFSFTYGAIEARMKVPAGNGFWPAFWMIYPTGVWPPEIDILEVLGDEPSMGFMTYHYLSSGNLAHSNIPPAQGVDFSAGFHVFTADWEPGSVTWYIDGANQGTFADPVNVASQPMFILLNLGVGGDAGGFTPGPPDNTTPFPSELTVDYVRAWQKQ